MLDFKVEKFSATGAIDAGLIDAIRRGETVVEGYYDVSSDGFLEFRQRNFIFTDKFNNLRFGKFSDNYQLMEFCKLFRDSLNIERSVKKCVNS